MKIIAPEIPGRPIYNQMLALKEQIRINEKTMPLKLHRAHTEFERVTLGKQLMVELRQMKEELKRLQFLAWEEA